MLDASIINQLAVISIVLSGVALLFGVFFISQKNRTAHMKAMLAASFMAVIFLVFYLTRLALGYEKAYAGPQEWKIAYFTLLISHVILAAANLPLAIIPLLEAFKGIKIAKTLDNIENFPEAITHFNKHRKWAKIAVPVWLYVAVTGWVIYVILHKYGEIRQG